MKKKNKEKGIKRLLTYLIISKKIEENREKVKEFNEKYLYNMR